MLTQNAHHDKGAVGPHAMGLVPDLPAFDSAWRSAQRYQPFFCEENVHQLLASGALPSPAAALFLTNAARTVAVWGQRAAVTDPIVWDYHVVALLPHHDCIIDLDDRTTINRPLRNWLAHAFRSDEPDLQPRFRCVPRDEFLATFHSDRSHMRDAHGRPLQPFPSWPALGDPAQPHNLQRFLDLADPLAGSVVDANGLLDLVASWPH